MLSPIDIEQEENKDEFAINIEESTNYIEPSTNQTFSPLYLKNPNLKVISRNKNEQLQPVKKCFTELQPIGEEPS